jgi:hypothetical protein
MQIVAKIKEASSGALQRPKQETVLSGDSTRRGCSPPDLVITLKNLPELGIAISAWIRK